MNYRSWWVSFLCLSVLSTLCCSSNGTSLSGAPAQQSIYDRHPEAMELLRGDTGARLQKAWAAPVLLVAASLGLIATAGGLYCKDKKRRSLLRKSLSAVRETPEQLGTDRASRARRKKQRWLIASGLACLFTGMLVGIPVIQLHRQIAAAKRALMSSV